MQDVRRPVSVDIGKEKKPLLGHATLDLLGFMPNPITKKSYCYRILEQNLNPTLRNGGVSVITEEFLKNGRGRCGYNK